MPPNDGYSYGEAEVEAEGEAERCNLLGGTFAILVQVALAVAAIATLIYKRHTERPRRPWLVWFFDASKQAFAGFLQHMVNLGFGVAFAAGGIATECAWYLLNFMISVVCGVLLLKLMMAIYHTCVERFGLHILRSGEYGKPPDWKPWLAQMVVWGFMASAEKGITALVVILPLHPHLDQVAQFIEAPLYVHPKLELLAVMVAAPVLLNALFFWIIDSLIMRRGGHAHHHAAEPEGDKRSLAQEEAAATIAERTKARQEEEAEERVLQDGVGFFTACWPKRRVAQTTDTSLL